MTGGGPGLLNFFYKKKQVLVTSKRRCSSLDLSETLLRLDKMSVFVVQTLFLLFFRQKGLFMNYVNGTTSPETQDNQKFDLLELVPYDSGLKDLVNNRE